VRTLRAKLRILTNTGQPEQWSAELCREWMEADPDLLPDHAAGTLTVRLHHLANRSSDVAIRHLCDELTATETVFPESL